MTAPETSIYIKAHYSKGRIFTGNRTVSIGEIQDVHNAEKPEYERVLFLIDSSETDRAHVIAQR